jgi:hypothetical protein
MMAISGAWALKKARTDSRLMAQMLEQRRAEMKRRRFTIACALQRKHVANPAYIR